MKIDVRLDLQRNYSKVTEKLFVTGNEGYWSNLDRQENERLNDAVQKMDIRKAVKAEFPDLYNIIFSPKRQAGIELLNLSGSERCVDYGCMWGALTISLAKRCGYVLGVDQTLDSLRFLDKRIKDEKLDNIDLLCTDLKKLDNFRDCFDIAVVNGVLEWIAEEGAIELKNYFGRHQPKRYTGNPGQQQLSFLKDVYKNLSINGKLYLAIENRFDFKMFFGCPDPHANLPFVSFLPRRIANWLSYIKLGRPYINWLYSFSGIKEMLSKAGFTKIDLYMCFPDYRYPERIIPYSGSLKNFNPTIALVNEKGQKPLRRLLARLGEIIIFNKLRLKCLAPSVIAIAHK